MFMKSKILLVLFLMATMFAFNATAQQNESIKPIKADRLVKVERENENAPRTLGNLFITCYYNNEYLEVEVPADAEYMEVVVSNEVGTIWTGLVTPESAECDIPYLSGQYLITCTTDSGTIYQGILSF